MGLEADAARLAGVRTVDRGFATLVESTDALRIVDVCHDQEFTILGIDGFLLRGSSVVPDMDAIADFSGASWQQSMVLAKQFISATKRPGLWYEFVVESAGGRKDSAA